MKSTDFIPKEMSGLLSVRMESWAAGNEAGETPHKSQSRPIGPRLHST